MGGINTMEERLVSVIVAAFNAEMYLAACIDSVLNQSYRLLELIVINDGSDDFTQKIAETYSEQDQRVKTYSFEHEGLAETRNHGLSVATGEYIVFLDSDDILLPGALDELVRLLNETEADVTEGKMLRGKGWKKSKFRRNSRLKNTQEKKQLKKFYIKPVFRPQSAESCLRKNYSRDCNLKKVSFMRI